MGFAPHPSLVSVLASDTSLDSQSRLLQTSTSQDSIVHSAPNGRAPLTAMRKAPGPFSNRAARRPLVEVEVETLSSGPLDSSTGLRHGRPNEFAHLRHSAPSMGTPSKGVHLPGSSGSMVAPVEVLRSPSLGGGSLQAPAGPMHAALPRVAAEFMNFHNATANPLALEQTVMSESWCAG